MDQVQAQVMVSAELSFFLRPGRRSGPVRVALDGTSTLGHLVESLGVPLTEVGRLQVNGGPAGPGYRPAHGDVVGVEAVRRPQHLPSARFVLWTVPASVDTRLSCPIRWESKKWVRHAAHIRRSTRRNR